MDHVYAQTNLQLYNQLVSRGRRDEELRATRDAYELAMSLFSGQFQANGKTVLAHLVGTASVLETLDVPIPIVIAGLLHAAYSRRGFEPGAEGLTPAKQRAVRRAAGPSVEETVAAYAALDWNPTAIATLHESCATLEGPQRDALLVRLANELEDQLDFGTLYSAGGIIHAFYLDGGSALVADMARGLGFEGLAVALDRAFAATATHDRPSALRSDREFRQLVPPGAQFADRVA